MDKRVLNFSLQSFSRMAVIGDSLSIENMSLDRIAFKVKTTNRTRYLVRPNAGTIDFYSTIKIWFVMQPSSDLPPPGESADKFLLQVTSYPGTESLPNDFWANRASGPPVSKLKFRVTFDENISQQPSFSFPKANANHSDTSRSDAVLSSETQHFSVQCKPLFSCFCKCVVGQCDQEP